MLRKKMPGADSFILLSYLALIMSGPRLEAGRGGGDVPGSSRTHMLWHGMGHGCGLPPAVACHKVFPLSSQLSGHHSKCIGIY